MAKYNKQQIIFFLSMLANLPNRIETDINDPTAQENIGEWTIVWSPEVYYHDPNKTWDNVMYVAKGQDSVKSNPMYIVATAGTNPKSIFNWFFEDLDTKNTVNWSNTNPERGKISNGTKTGLTILQNMQDKSNLSLLQFLTNEIKTQPDTVEIEVITTGHSLGGALSPVLALWLYENQNTWNPDAKKVTVSTQLSAGATPGDQTFATYFDNTDLGKNHTTRIWNSLDIVPHAWAKKQLSQIPTLYRPCNISKSLRIYALVQAQIYRVKDTNYQHINSGTPPLQGVCGRDVNSKNSDLKQFLQEAYYQHIKAYFELMQVNLPSSKTLDQSLTLTDQDLDNVVAKLLQEAGQS